MMLCRLDHVGAVAACLDDAGAGDDDAWDDDTNACRAAETRMLRERALESLEASILAN